MCYESYSYDYIKSNILVVNMQPCALTYTDIHNDSSDNIIQDILTYL